MKLIRPAMEYDLQIQAFRKEYMAYGGSMDGSSGLRKFENTRDWLDQLNPRETLYLYLREEDNKVVGIIKIRHQPEEYAGHIGYCVLPGERRKGYAGQMLALVLPECRKLGIHDVLVYCLAGNEASRRTILRCGGVYEATVSEPRSGKQLEQYRIHPD